MSRPSYATMQSTGTRAPEKKVIDTTLVSAVADTTGTVQLVNGVAVGTDFTDRIGRKIILKSVDIIGHVFPVDASTSDCLCRMMLVYDKQPNGATPALAAFINGDSTSHLNLNNRDRFVVLSNWMEAIGSFAATPVGSPTTHKVQIHRKINMETLFSGTTNAVASISTGALWVVTVGDQAANVGGTFVGTVRVRFIDA